ncbi:hypothetical protein BOTBODRAFT_99198 [Botryobasidium botryosum FD-172 SS1]|uniref:Phosphatidate cytidylyltransferase n=1 Tax=Botryobasidium botryosum (strain FD-172 SS1) TaxID=930990 RepID=A0A067NDE4_BOTB1|nr:hypothetical protein BOTBODRAFT_99198 [Botryobasidium botryosum FD-172 SS1]
MPSPKRSSQPLVPEVVPAVATIPRAPTTAQPLSAPPLLAADAGAAVDASRPAAPVPPREFKSKNTSEAEQEQKLKPNPAKVFNVVKLLPTESPTPEPQFLKPNNTGGPDHDAGKKKQQIATRVVTTLAMIFGFLTLLAMGHVYMIILVLACQTLVYREVTALFGLSTKKEKKVEPEGKDPWSKTLNWYFFAVTNYFLYGESIIYYFKHVVFSDAQFLPFAANHRFISFMLYIIGFVGFVTSLKRQYLRQQFGLFCWVHMTLLVIVVSSHFIVNNILEGLIWFWVPASLVICNDVFAYIWGMTFGKTPLIKLSPKKTVEGFVGALFSTLLFGLLWGTFFMRFDYMICPVRHLGVSVWSDITCKPNPVFLWREFQVPSYIAALFVPILGHPLSKISYAPFQFHALIMALFASLFAPFGGFFASGFKRAFDIKDFGDSIPGHGGMTDRMDCQFMMGMFAYVYYSSLIRTHNVTVGSVLETIVSGLTVEEQKELLLDLKRYLDGTGANGVRSFLKAKTGA